MLIARQLDPAEWVGNRRPLAVLPWEPEDIPLNFDQVYDDLDYLKIAVVETRDGRSFGLIRYQHSPTQGVEVFVHANEQEMPDAPGSLLAAFEIGRDSLRWVSPLAEVGKG